MNEHASNVLIGASTTVTCINNQVVFTNSSQPPIGQTIKYSWSFGDATTDTAASPSHSYTTTGTKAVSMTVTTSKGCKKTAGLNISVSSPPNITFTHDSLNWYSHAFHASITGLAQYGWNFWDSLGYVFSYGANVNSYTWNQKGWHKVSLIAIDANGCAGTFEDSVETWSNVGVEESAASKFGVSMYPNPFSTIANVAYTLEKPSSVTVKVFDMLGRNVAEFNKGLQGAGKYKQEINSEGFSAGAYIIRLQIDDQVISRQMVQAR